VRGDVQGSVGSLAAEDGVRLRGGAIGTGLSDFLWGFGRTWRG